MKKNTKVTMLRLICAALFTAIIPLANGWVVMGATIIPAAIASQIGWGVAGVYWTTAVGFIPVWGWAAAAIVGL